VRRPGPRIAGKLPAMAVVVRVGWRLVLLVVATAEEEEGEEGCLLGLVQRGIGRRKFQMLPFLWGGGGFSRWHDRRRTLEVEASRAPRAVSEGHRRAEGGGSFNKETRKVWPSSHSASHMTRFNWEQLGG